MNRTLHNKAVRSDESMDDEKRTMQKGVGQDHHALDVVRVHEDDVGKGAVDQPRRRVFDRWRHV